MKRLNRNNTYFQNLQKKIKSILSVIRIKPFSTDTVYGRSQERYRRVVLSAGSSLIYKGVTIITSLISVPLTVNYLGAERYGLWMTITSTLAILTFADLGIGNGLLNAISKADGLNDNSISKKAISSAFFMLLVVAFFLCISFLLIYPFISWSRIFNVTSKIAISESGSAMAVMFFMFIINLPLGVIQKTQIGFQEVYKNNLWLGFGAILGLGGVVFMIFAGRGLPWLVLAIMGGPLLATILNGYFLFFRNNTELLPSWRSFNMSFGMKLAGTGCIFLFLQLFSVIGTFADNIIIAHVLGASYVAGYAITKKLFLVLQFGQFIISPLWPAFGEAMYRKDFKWAKKTLVRILILSIFIGTVTALPLLVFGKSIIAIWVGKEFVPSMALLAGFFCWSIFNNYVGSMSVFLNNDLFIKKELVIIGIAAIFSILFQTALCAQVGIEGVVWGMLLSYSIFYMVPVYKLAFGTLGALIREQ
ncbi:MAG: hypothetical protein A2Y40_05435 [Candidatus Margulisbacteria bacterium GWF2_35_9]|nr:MAG: hypothetical protein A2Y40_05435 [Candidatus Margulisbacteria bacterium GWF2_35_9]